MARRWLAVGFGASCVALLFACGARSGLEPGQLFAGDGGTAALAGVATVGVAGLLNGGAGATFGTAGKPSAGASQAGSTTGGFGGSVAEGGDAGAMAQVGGAPCVSTTEVCNGLDDDCDGEIDEDLPLVDVKGPVALRTDEGSTAPAAPISCISCTWAWYPQLVESDDQLGVAWYLGIDGGYEKPSTFGRKVSWDLAPQGDVASLGPQVWLETLRRGPITTRGSLLTFVERLGNSDFYSLGFMNHGLQMGNSLHLGGCGGPGSSDTLAPLLSNLVACGKQGELELFTLGEDRLEFTAQRSFGLQQPNQPPQLVGMPSAALRGARGLVVAPATSGPGPSASSKLWSREISADGAPLADSLWQDLDGFRDLRIEGLFSTPDGYLLFGEDRGDGTVWPSGRFVAPLAPDGKLAGPIEYSDAGKLKDFDEVVVTQIGSGFAVVEQIGTSLVVEQLDANAQQVGRLEQLVAPYSRPSVLFAHGKLYVTYVEEPPFSANPNRVLVSSFACRPP